MKIRWNKLVFGADNHTQTREKSDMYMIVKNKVACVPRNSVYGLVLASAEVKSRLKVRTIRNPVPPR